jgi:hypothetical protein
MNLKLCSRGMHIIEAGATLCLVCAIGLKAYMPGNTADLHIHESSRLPVSAGTTAWSVSGTSSVSASLVDGPVGVGTSFFRR